MLWMCVSVIGKNAATAPSHIAPRLLIIYEFSIVPRMKSFPLSPSLMIQRVMMCAIQEKFFLSVCRKLLRLEAALHSTCVVGHR